MSKNRKFIGTFLDEQDNKIDGSEFTAWHSRSCAVTVIIADTDLNMFLLERRGPGCPDNIGKLCFPCGYLDWDETTAEAAAREVYEEIGLKIDPRNLEFVEYQDNPKAHLQNITFRFLYRIPSDELHKIANNNRLTDASERGGESNEVSELVLIHPVAGHDFPDNDFAFGHNKLMMSVLDRRKS